MEVMIPSPAVDFNFDSASTTPYVSAPASPQRFGSYYCSAPTSPTRISSFYHDFNHGAAAGEEEEDVQSVIPFNWEEKPGVPKRNNTKAEEEMDFAFDFSGQLERPSLSADELFYGGKIKPLKPPPRFVYTPQDSPRSPKSPKNKFIEALSPRHKKKDIDPFSAALQQTSDVQDSQKTEYTRGRERTYNSSSSSSRRHKPTRSLSPYRVSDMLSEQENVAQNSNQPSNASSSTSSALTWYKNWKLKDLLLFRSASEGHATTIKEPLKKHAALRKTHNEDVKNSSFRSTDSGGSVSLRRKGSSVSAHEYHYKMNRAMSEEMRRKTFLPYKQGLLGCLGFNPAVHEFTRGIGSMISRQ